MKIRLSLLLLLLLTCCALAAQSPYNAIGDTLTVIQVPLLNVPAIHTPGETLSITCLAPPSTTGWQADLLHGSKTIPLSLLSSEYLSSPDRWLLQALIPQVPVFELYDLRVTASGGIWDITQNAVHLVPSRKTHYYFAHITDPHLPNRVYYPNAGFDSDSTSVSDLRAVMDDINLIQPEFVLLTGDLLNEGELEGFAGQYWYGWSQRVLAEFEVPVFLTSGNHDIGGWNSTPPPAGSARRNWWRYFGWNWLDNPSTTWNQHTQDYSFIYGNTHFIGLEAYLNYDNWRSNIYGGQSFIYSQINWLNNQLTLHPDKTRVLFHHYDFSDQLDLSQLGVDMALWGHLHYNTGSIYTHPYNLGTRSTCNGNRAYRIVRVNGSQLQPLSTIYAGSSGNNLQVNYYPANNATADSLLAILSNSQNMAFENTLLKFRMPAGNWGYTVYNGVLEQVDRSGEHNVCYVRVNLPANSVRYVSIAVSGTGVGEETAIPAASLIRSVYPNPFSTRLSILPAERLSSLSLKVYNLKGELVRTLDGSAAVRSSQLDWDGRNSAGAPLPAGIYFLRAESGTRTEIHRIVKLSCAGG